MNAYTQPTRVDLVNNAVEECNTYIATQVIQNYGGSYQTYETLGHQWRTTMRYSETIEKALIKYATFYFRMLSDKQIDGNRIKFIKSISGPVSHYLAKYTMLGRPGTAAEIEAQRVRELLFDNSPYIAALREHAAKEEKAKQKRKAKKEARKEKAAKAAAAAQKAKEDKVNKQLEIIIFSIKDAHTKMRGRKNR